jgi:hypothetical protein
MKRDEVTPELLLATLNGQRDFTCELSFNRLSGHQSPSPSEQLNDFESLGADQQELRDACKIISNALPRHLKRHLAAWITSGYNVQNVWESPRARKLDAKGRSAIEMWLWLQQSSTVTFSNSGKVSLDLSASDYEGLPIAEPEEYAEIEAARIFLWLLNERELRYAIAMCADCGRFYFRLKPRRYYEKATFCTDCRHKASVSRRMKKVREDKEDLIIRAAITAHQKWLELSPESRRRFRDVSAYIICQIGPQFGVTRNWVTRHRDEIIPNESVLQVPQSPGIVKEDQ